jgi:hypothetical protein
MRRPCNGGDRVRLVRRYLSRVRPPRGRVYQEVHYEPGEAMQVDWGDCGSVRIGQTTRRVSVFVAVLCYSRMMYLEFTLAQKKAEFYRAIVAALRFLHGSPRKLMFDNLKAAVLSPVSGQSACSKRRDCPICRAAHHRDDARSGPQGRSTDSACPTSVIQTHAAWHANLKSEDLCPCSNGPIGRWLGPGVLGSPPRAFPRFDAVGNGVD